MIMTHRTLVNQRMVVACFLLGFSSVVWAQDPQNLGAPKTSTVLVTGANRGLGLELVRQYASKGWTVIAAARAPERARELAELAASSHNVAIEQLDVTDRRSIAALSAKYEHTVIDVLVDNAGVLGDMQAQTLGSLDYGEFERVMAVNVYGALAVADAFREQVAASNQKKIVALTSRSGILSEPGYRGPYFYRASKAALNMVMKVLADELRGRGVVVALVAPFPSDTEMLRALIGVEAASRQTRPADSAADLVRVIDGLTLANTEKPVLADGSKMPW
jgi:NAD(P)-dependent dehydrogenase (short-subunit alcohol dehydrogenase family)